MNTTERILSSKLTIGFILLFHFIAGFFLSSVLDVHPDTADYWIWSRKLSLGYNEHPPMIAFIFWMVNFIFNDIVFGIKISSALISTTILFVAYNAARQFIDRTSSLIFVLILGTTPYIIFATPIYLSVDQPYLVFWPLCIFSVGKFIKTKNPYWILLFGISAGFGALSKYFMVLLPISMTIWLLINKPARKLFYHWQSYVGALIALLIISPNLYWNSQHEWITFFSALEKALKGASFGANFVFFLGLQFIFFSLVYTLFFWWQLLTKKISSEIFDEDEKEDANQKWSFLLVTGLVPFVFFIVLSLLSSHIDPRWVNVAYISFFMLVAKSVATLISQGYFGRQLSLFLVSLFLNISLLVVVIVQVFYIFIPYQNPLLSSLTSFTGWEKTATQIKELYQYRSIEIPKYVVSLDKQLSSPLGLYMEHHPFPFALENQSRNIWGSTVDIQREGAIAVCSVSECRSFLAEASNQFKAQLNYLGEIKTVENGKVLRKLKLFHLKGS